MSNFRKCAGIIVFNSAKKVLVCARNDVQEEQWQFPQGGIMENESSAEAALRELYEETSICSVKLIKTLENPLKYEFPLSIKQKFQHRGIKNIGQEMFWSLAYFYGSENEINLQTKEPEFKAWEWIDIDEAANRIVHFKKQVYEEAILQLKPVMENFSI